MDKPTKDELVELLSSSKFTAGTWEQFSCYLPNMTQGIITGIKEKGSTEEDSMSAVAQHCLDNSPDITWRTIINALLDANEKLLCCFILEEETGARKTVAKVFIDHYSNLSQVITSSIRPIADEMYSKRLISRAVKNDPSVNKIENEFLVLASLCKEDVIMLRQKCLTFLQCIASVKGPAEEVAIALARDWEHQVFKCNHVPFPLHQEMTKKSNIIVNSKNSIVMEFSNLQEEFACLIAKIREYYAVSKKHDAINIARWVEEFIDEVDCLAHENSNFDDLFRKMKPHYNLINIELIEILIKVFPIDDTLKSRFNAYSIKLDNFVQSVEISDIITRINTALQHEETKNNCKLVIKLSGRWSKQSIGNFHKLMEYFFGDKTKYLTYEKFLDGSIIIRFVISSNKIALILIDMAYTRVRFMRHFGILQLFINNETIINRNEENFKFEQSLYDAIICNFHNFMEYQKIILFLLQLEIDINYQNEHGDTTLMLASRNGHHQVVELLLSKDPDINIQDNDGLTALIHAIDNGHHQVVELLLSKDPDINIQNNDGWTALSISKRESNLEAVSLYSLSDYIDYISLGDLQDQLQLPIQLLMDKDPDINIRDNDGWTALTYSSSMPELHHHTATLFIGRTLSSSLRSRSLPCFKQAIASQQISESSQNSEVLLSENSKSTSGIIKSKEQFIKPLALPELETSIFLKCFSELVCGKSKLFSEEAFSLQTLSSQNSLDFVSSTNQSDESRSSSVEKYLSGSSSIMSNLI